MVSPTATELALINIFIIVLIILEGIIKIGSAKSDDIERYWMQLLALIWQQKPSLFLPISTPSRWESRKSTGFSAFIPSMISEFLAQFENARSPWLTISWKPAHCEMKLEENTFRKLFSMTLEDVYKIGRGTRKRLNGGAERDRTVGLSIRPLLPLGERVTISLLLSVLIYLPPIWNTFPLKQP